MVQFRCPNISYIVSLWTVPTILLKICSANFTDSHITRVVQKAITNSNNTVCVGTWYLNIRRCASFYIATCQILCAGEHLISDSNYTQSAKMSISKTWSLKPFEYLCQHRPDALVSRVSLFEDLDRLVMTRSFGSLPYLKFLLTASTDSLR